MEVGKRLHSIKSLQKHYQFWHIGDRLMVASRPRCPRLTKMRTHMHSDGSQYTCVVICNGIHKACDMQKF